MCWILWCRTWCTCLQMSNSLDECGVLLWSWIVIVFLALIALMATVLTWWAIQLCGLSKLSSCTHGTRLILPWPSARQMPSLYKLCIIHHPKASEVIFVSHETFVQRQIGADCVLQGCGKEREKRRQN